MGKDATGGDNLAGQLQKANEEIQRLKEVIREKDLEVSFVVHDLKNPLSIIEMNFSLINGVLEDHEDLSKLRRISGLVESQIVAMKHLIHELLNISKMENSKHKLELADVHADRFLEYILEENTAAAENNGISLRLSIEDDIGVVSIDQNLMERVFANLIINAIKYSLEDGEVVLHALKSDKPDHVRFIIEDFGIGIAPENREKVFNKFEHSKTQDHTKRVSHGLGLYFSKLVVELHGGTIWVESELDKGSKFVFDLPRKPPAA